MEQLNANNVSLLAVLARFFLCVFPINKGANVVYYCYAYRSDYIATRLRRINAVTLQPMLLVSGVCLCLGEKCLVCI